ncbi:nuclear transport factor 2 family protein [Streptomyces avicenniae]|uniref:nuclear transport factor 2 family protein n=1 Tax=Streptomyces avicenniae TaxID=500153 RepID=UPI000699D344|nr:nuclear transport factor 2 family protein [Streptomyces avicenniae]
MPDATPPGLPAPIRHYLDAHRAHDTTTALASFTPDATVTDSGRTWAGTAEIATWLAGTTSDYTYTVTPAAADCEDDAHCTATLHLSGDLPGGAHDLAYTFTLRDSLIYTLTVTPA